MPITPNYTPSLFERNRDAMYEELRTRDDIVGDERGPTRLSRFEHAAVIAVTEHFATWPDVTQRALYVQVPDEEAESLVAVLSCFTLGPKRVLVLDASPRTDSRAERDFEGVPGDGQRRAPVKPVTRRRDILDPGSEDPTFAIMPARLRPSPNGTDVKRDWLRQNRGVDVVAIRFQDYVRAQDNYGLVVAYEAHRINSPLRVVITDHFPSARILFLSADPKEPEEDVSVRRLAFGVTTSDEGDGRVKMK